MKRRKLNKYMLVRSNGLMHIFQSDGLTIQEFGRTGIMGVDKDGAVVFLIPAVEFYYLVRYDER